MADEKLEVEVPPEEELDFARESLQKLYNSGEVRGINPERWNRVRQSIHFEDVVADLSGQSGGGSIRCPFHGRDSTPSFWLYKGTNDGWCFGCPPGEQYYDHVRFVSRYMEISRVRALQWLEKKWELPPLDDVSIEQDEEEYVVSLELMDLVEPYILLASKKIQQFKDVELAEDYLKNYFEAQHYARLSDELKKQGESEEASEYQVKAVNVLARILGKQEINRILSNK